MCSFKAEDTRSLGNTLEIAGTSINYTQYFIHGDGSIPAYAYQADGNDARR